MYLELQHNHADHNVNLLFAQIEDAGVREQHFIVLIYFFVENVNYCIIKLLSRKNSMLLNCKSISKVSFYALKEKDNVLQNVAFQSQNIFIDKIKCHLSAKKNNTYFLYFKFTEIFTELNISIFYFIKIKLNIL